jgi:hypothetical protein
MAVVLLQREFVVSLPLPGAWDHLARVEQWPSWAAHIKRIELQPPGELGIESTGVIHLTNVLKPPFRVTEFNPPCNWKWVGPFLWANVVYDHQFEVVDAEHTRFIWTVEAQGFGAAVLGPLFARIYRRSLDRAIPRLIAEIEGQTRVANSPCRSDSQPVRHGANVRRHRRFPPGSPTVNPGRG